MSRLRDTSYPTGLPINTPLGTLTAAVTSGEHCHVEGRVIVRGVEYKIAFHINRQKDGSFGPNEQKNWPGHYEQSAVTIDRPDDWRKTPSESARKAILNAVLPAINEWAQNEYKNGTAFFYGDRYQRDSIISAANEKIEAAEKVIADQKAQIVCEISRGGPPDNTQSDIPWGDVLDYFRLFSEEYQRATGKSCGLDAGTIGQQYAIPKRPIRVAVQDEIEAQRAEGRGFDASMEYHETPGHPPVDNPYKAGHRHHDLWQKGWDDYVKIIPQIKQLQKERDERGSII